MTALCKIKNPSIEPVTLPYPFRGALGGLRSVVVALTVAEVLTFLAGSGGTTPLQLADVTGSGASADTFYQGDAVSGGGISPAGFADITASGTVQGAHLKDTSLTAGRFAIVGTGGQLADDSDATFSGSTTTLTNLVVTTALTQGASGSMAAGSGGISTTGDLDAAGGFHLALGPFVQDNVAANQAAVALAIGATAAPQLESVAPRAGSLVGIIASFTVAPAGTDLVVSVYKNGTLLNAAAILTVTAGATLGRAVAFAKDTYTFAAGDRVGVRVTTGAGWTATTSDIAAWAILDG